MGHSRRQQLISLYYFRYRIATVERREASVPRHGTRRASLARIVAPRKRDNKTSAPVGAPPTPLPGWTRTERTTRAQKRAAGTKKTALFGIVNSRRAPLRGSHPNVSNRRRLPAAARLRACRMPGRATRLPAPAAIHQRARALYFSCYLQERPAGLHPPRAQGTRATLARDTRPPLGPHASRPRYARSSA